MLNSLNNQLKRFDKNIKAIKRNGIVVASVTLVKVTRGGKKPLSVAYTSNLAEGFGVVVPIPVWALL
jgi:aspartate/methionine/tyrosine aminotransferase